MLGLHILLKHYLKANNNCKYKRKTLYEASDRKWSCYKNWEVGKIVLGKIVLSECKIELREYILALPRLCIAHQIECNDWLTVESVWKYLSRPNTHLEGPPPFRCVFGHTVHVWNIVLGTRSEVRSLVGWTLLEWSLELGIYITIYVDTVYIALDNTAWSRP